jgi:hypothetical protein
VLTLRYGLAEDDERPRSSAETAQELGLSRSMVQYLERDARIRIRALVHGTGTVVEKDGRKQITGVYRFTSPALTPEDEAVFRQAVMRLREQGVSVSGRTLTRITGKSYGRASVFLHQYRETLGLPSRTQVAHEQRMAHLKQVAAELEAKGERLTIKRLAEAAHIRKDTIVAFLRQRKQEQEEGRHAAQAR